MNNYSKPLGLKGNWSYTEESGESGQIICVSNITLIYRAGTSPKRSRKQAEKDRNLVLYFPSVWKNFLHSLPKGMGKTALLSAKIPRS
jgi:hypothetical protein